MKNKKPILLYPEILEWCDGVFVTLLTFNKPTIEKIFGSFFGCSAAGGSRVRNWTEQHRSASCLDFQLGPIFDFHGLITKSLLEDLRLARK